METLNIVDPGWPWGWQLLMLSPWAITAVIVLVLYLGSFTQTSPSRVRSWRSGIGSVSSIGAVIGIIPAMMGSLLLSAVYSNDLKSAQEDALTDAGYSVVKIEPGEDFDMFFGGDDGSMGAGLLVHLEGDTWQVVSGGVPKS